MGTPIVDDLKAVINMKIINNNVVITDDINWATKACSPDVGEIKCKTNRIRPTSVIKNIVEIPYRFL